jgi:hypothetical protein
MNLQMFLANVSCTTNMHPLSPDSIVTDEAKVRKTQTRSADSSIQKTVSIECDYIENSTIHNRVDEACESCADEGEIKVMCTDGIHHYKSSHMKPPDESQETKSVDAKRESAQSEWKRIQATMARRIPVCRGHGEPCVFRAVIKKGPNLGRGFYVCARAQASLLLTESGLYLHLPFDLTKKTEKNTTMLFQRKTVSGYLTKVYMLGFKEKVTTSLLLYNEQIQAFLTQNLVSY